MADNWSERVSKLLDEDLRFSTLNEIKENFEALPRSEALRVAKHLQLPLIFDCLNDTNKEQVELACDVLSLCMSQLSLGESTDRYDVFIERALNHPFVPVKIMALNEIERNIVDEQVLLDLGKRVSLLTLIIRNIGDDDLSVARKAADIITKVGVTHSGIKQLLLPEVVKVFHEVISTSEVVKLRVFELIIDVSIQSEAGQKLLESAGFFGIVLKDLENNDVLLRINIIELLARLVITKHGYFYLESQGCIDKIFHQLEDDSDPVSQQLCEPGILQFFGNMMKVKPAEIISKYPKIVFRIFSNLDSDDLIIFGVSLDTFGFMASTDMGKFALDSIPENRTEEAIKTIVSRLVSLPTELKARVLKTIEILLRVDSISSQVTAITLKWYKIMGDTIIDKITTYAKNPFGEIRCAGLGVLCSLALQQWGQEVIQGVPGLVEFLLDRNAETTKESKELKYEIVKLLSRSSVFDHTTLLRLKAYVKEGPFYVQAITEVAIEGNE